MTDDAQRSEADPVAKLVAAARDMYNARPKCGCAKLSSSCNTCRLGDAIAAVAGRRWVEATPFGSEPRGCPTPGACSSPLVSAVEDEERERLAGWLEGWADDKYDPTSRAHTKMHRIAALLREPQPQAAGTVSIPLGDAWTLVNWIECERDVHQSVQDAKAKLRAAAIRSAEAGQVLQAGSSVDTGGDEIRPAGQPAPATPPPTWVCPSCKYECHGTPDHARQWHADCWRPGEPDPVVHDTGECGHATPPPAPGGASDEGLIAAWHDGKAWRYPGEEGCDMIDRLIDRGDALAARLAERSREAEKMRSVQDACRERIYALLCDDDLTEDKLREFVDGPLPEIHDALHQANGYAASECFTQGPAEKYLRERAEAECERLRQRIAELERDVEHYKMLRDSQYRSAMTLYEENKTLRRFLATHADYHRSMLHQANPNAPCSVCDEIARLARVRGAAGE